MYLVTHSFTSLQLTLSNNVYYFIKQLIIYNILTQTVSYFVSLVVNNCWTQTRTSFSSCRFYFWNESVTYIMIHVCMFLQLFDDFIFAFFSLEMTIKMVAMGIWGRGSYLADSWNRLDLFIVLAGAVEYFVKENMNLSAIRTIRVLRPLRAINRIPSKYNDLCSVVFCVMITFCVKYRNPTRFF